MSLFSRITKRIKSTTSKFKTDCSFSFKYASLRVVDELGGRIGLKGLSKKARASKEQWALNYLKENLSSVIEKYKNAVDESVYDDNSPIWVCWWTGEETAPPLVKQCIKSIKANAKTRPVVFIHKDNWSEYIDIPDYILKKVEANKICLANFSDYLRVSLVGKYGGLWIDATVFCSQAIPEEVFKLPFFSCKSEYDENCPYTSKMRWTAFILGGQRENMFFKYMKSAFDEYWFKHDYSIDYLLVDYLIVTAYNEIPRIRDQIDNVPINNPKRDDLQMAMNLALPSEKFAEVVDSNTCLYKLSWRETYSLTTSDGKESIYSYFLKMKFEAESDNY